MKNPVPSILLITVILAVFQGSPDPVTGREPAAEDVVRNLQATFCFNLLNHLGIMTNKQDDVDGLKQNLARHFKESDVDIIGCGALFWGRL